MAFVFCALIMYILWWDKPFGIEHKTVVTFPTLENSPHPERPLNIAEFRDYRQSDLTLESFFGMIFNINSADFTKNEFVTSLVFYSTGTVFSAIHLAAWNWEFPSLIEHTLWRVFAAISTGIPLFSMALIVISEFVPAPNIYDEVENLVIVFLLFAIIVYFISRLGLIVLIFCCFSSMPASVYETVEWTKYLPHFQ